MKEAQTLYKCGIWWDGEGYGGIAAYRTLSDAEAEREHCIRLGYKPEHVHVWSETIKVYARQAIEQRQEAEGK